MGTGPPGGSIELFFSLKPKSISEMKPFCGRLVKKMKMMNITTDVFWLLLEKESKGSNIGAVVAKTLGCVSSHLTKIT
jgi:hypothetical protein